MTVTGFRRIALALDGAIEHAHHGHPDFRVGGKIFATLGYPSDAHGALGLTPEQQRFFLRDHPDAFTPAAGKWGEQGSTVVRLKAVDEETLGEVLTLAWQNTVARAPKATARKAVRKKLRSASTRARSPSGRRPSSSRARH